ncbi:MAG: hypothetical protein JO047_04550 [Alphaproteobacteria bacterium]|nr:hypothetical protein [Alphaproteobacteria bacterium]
MTQGITAPIRTTTARRELPFKAALAVIGWLALGIFAVPAWAACDAAAPPLPSFDQARGVRTKWLSLAPDARNTILPDLEGLPLKQWMANLEATGVNLAELNLEPSWKLASYPVVSDAQLMQAVDAYYTPAAQRSAQQQALVAQFEQTVFPSMAYTAAQQDAVLLDFLRRLEALRRQDEIAGSVRFMVHQRLWIPPERGEPGAQREYHVAQFAGDMAGFVNLAERSCLGHWIAGVRWGEHSNNDMGELLPLTVELAQRINAGSNGWLRRHLFLVNGGGWGAEYRGIDRVVGADGKPFPFFPRIAAETGGFAFAYKWMMFRDATARGIRGHMRGAYCAQARPCDEDSVGDWITYLGKILGFDDLLAFVGANRARYPADANVVFVGDSSDSVAQMVQVDDDGRLYPAASLVAVQRLFARGGGAFAGKIFMNGYPSVKVMTGRQRRLDGFTDTGRELYAVDADGRSRLLPQSDRLWADWPRLAAPAR